LFLNSPWVLLDFLLQRGHPVCVVSTVALVNDHKVVRQSSINREGIIVLEK
jgi:hypothetical protein